MKKIMRKLVLSSFALGLAAVTLTTTTFAWYTSNMSVDAKNITSTTASSGADLLMITQDLQDVGGVKKPYNWKTSLSKVELEDKGELMPLQYNLKGDGQVDPTNDYELYEILGAQKATEGWLEFTLYFKNASNDDATLYLQKLNITNTTGTLPAKDILASGRKALNLSDSYTGTTYTIDVLRTLMVAVTVENYELKDEDATSVSLVSTKNDILNPQLLMDSTKLDLDDYVPYVEIEGDDPSTADVVEESYSTGWNAHKYYNAVMDGTEKDLKSIDEKVYNAINLVAVNSGSSDYELAPTLPKAGTAKYADQYVKITFRIFINGWDWACFDACQEQTFNVELSFTTDEEKALEIEA